MANLNTNLLSFNTLTSRAGLDARVLSTGPIDFTTNQTYNIDLTAVLQSANLAHPVQAAYIDCAGINYGSTTLTVSGTGQRIMVPPGAQGYYPLLIGSRNFVFSLSNFSSVGQTPNSATAYLYFVNVPMAAAEWSGRANASGGGGPVTGPVRIVTAASDVATTSDYTILCDCSNRNASIYQYLPGNLTGFQTIVINVVKVDSTSNVVTVAGNGASINGATNVTYIELAAAYQSVTLQWSGGVWEIIGSHAGWMNTELGQARFDLRNIGNLAASQSWWRFFADVTNGFGNKITCGFYDVLNNRIGGGFDANGAFVVSNSLTLSNPANIAFGAGWQTWTPTVNASGSMTISSLVLNDVRYLQIGPLIYFNFCVTFTTGGVASNQVFATLPFNAIVPAGANMILTTGWYFNGAPPNEIGFGYANNGGFLVLSRSGGVNLPLTSGIQLSVSGFYRAA